ncbi:hypothetical protein LWI28_028773 [Acer negundo]|uniref:Uncharacterized protein n=1 Tax=Acer negundo TaxID=4023 RepID=A0AAD5NGK7_ACENE|nr:hypothetical protein LWI28_028773 [Acer negundo]
MNNERDYSSSEVLIRLLKHYPKIKAIIYLSSPLSLYLSEIGLAWRHSQLLQTFRVPRLHCSKDRRREGVVLMEGIGGI